MRHKLLLEVVHGELESIIAVAHRPLEHRVDRRNAVLRVLERWPLGEDDAVAIGQRKVMGHAGRSHHGSAALMQGGGSGKQPGSRRGRASSCGSAAHGAAAQSEARKQRPILCQTILHPLEGFDQDTQRRVCLPPHAFEHGSV